MRVAISILVAIVAAAGLSVPNAVLADIYGRVDESGAIYLSDRAGESGFRLMLRERAVARTAKRAAVPRLVLPLAARPYHAEVLQALREHGVEPALLHAVISAESAYDARAVSRKGARGLMQVLPATAERYGVAPAALASTSTNIRIGARYLADLLWM